MQINDSGLSAASLTKGVALFYAGRSVGQVAITLGVGRGVIAGRFERAGVVRQIDPDWTDTQFDAETSKVFAERMAYGFNPVEAGASLGKSAGASRRHAAALGLFDPQAKAPPKVLTQPPRARRPREAEAAPVAAVEPIRPWALEGGGCVAFDGQVSREHDDAHVAACLAQGGFERYDFATGWTVGPDGDKRWPFRADAIAEAKALVSAAKAAPWVSTFAEAVSVSEGRAA